MTINVQAVYEQKDQEYARRLQAAPSLDEMFAVMAVATPLPEGYDLRQALIDNRKAAGERPPFLETRAQE